MPSWTRTPSNATAKVLNSVTFSCLATGNPTPKYTWYHNGVPVIQGSSARKSINTNNNDLTISSIIENDRGMVQCVAWNVAGHVIGTARLTVDGKLSQLLLFYWVPCGIRLKEIGDSTGSPSRGFVENIVKIFFL